MIITYVFHVYSMKHTKLPITILHVLAHVWKSWLSKDFKISVAQTQNSGVQKNQMSAMSAQGFSCLSSSRLLLDHLVAGEPEDSGCVRPLAREESCTGTCARIIVWQRAQPSSRTTFCHKTSVETKADKRDDDSEAGAQRSRKNVLFLPSILTITSFPLRLRWSTKIAAFGHRVAIGPHFCFLRPPPRSLYLLYI